MAAWQAEWGEPVVVLVGRTGGHRGGRCVGIREEEGKEEGPPTLGQARGQAMARQGGGSVGMLTVGGGAVQQRRLKRVRDDGGAKELRRQQKMKSGDVGKAEARAMCKFAVEAGDQREQGRRRKRGREE